MTSTPLTPSEMGKLGGDARALALSPRRRKAIAKAASDAATKARKKKKRKRA